jgi:hypothetical protein
VSDLPTFDPRDLRRHVRAVDDRRRAPRRAEDLLVELALSNLPVVLLEAERRVRRLHDERAHGVSVVRAEGRAEGLALALEHLTGRSAADLRARAVEVLEAERSTGLSGIEACRRMIAAANPAR